MAYNRKDHYYRKAKEEGKASRAAYKLIQLQERFHLIRKGAIVLDLGSAPGGWLQELSVLVGPAGRVIGIDLLPLKIALPKNAAFIQGNIEDDTTFARLKAYAEDGVTTIVCDMAPNTSGVSFADAYRSFELAIIALTMCHQLLKEGGNFLVKIFPGDELDHFHQELQKYFKKVQRIVPPATRKTSSELYFVCTGYKKAC